MIGFRGGFGGRADLRRGVYIPGAGSLGVMIDGVDGGEWVGMTRPLTMLPFGWYPNIACTGWTSRRVAPGGEWVGYRTRL